MPTTNQIEIKKYITPEVKKGLTAWEKTFISSLYKRVEPWTEKQIEVFDKIKKKYTLSEHKVIEKIVYLPIGYADGAKLNQEITSREYRKNRFKNKK
jgi:hypothetical protein